MGDEVEHDVEDLLTWLTKSASLMHIHLGIERSDGKKKLIAGEKMNLYRLGKDDKWAGESDKGHALKGIDDHPGDFRKYPKKQRNYAVFPWLWPVKDQALLVLDGDFGPSYNANPQTEARKEVLLHLLSVAGGTMPDKKSKVLPLAKRMRFVLVQLLVLSGAMRPDNFFQSLYMLRGSGGNSKGAMVKMLKKVFGNQYLFFCSIYFLLF